MKQAQADMQAQAVILSEAKDLLPAGRRPERRSFASLRRTLLAALSTLAGCGSIGDGSTIQSLQIYLAPVGGVEQGTMLDSGEPTEQLRMFDCFCSNLDALGIFTSGTVSSNFRYRVTFTSSDESVLEVMNVGDALNSLCPLIQQGPGLLIPKGPGTATITAEFIGLRDSLTVEVVPTTAGSYTLQPTDATNAGAVAVGSTLPLTLEATLDDGRTRFLNGNVVSWDFVTPDETVATISSAGVRGWGTNGGAPLRAQANFGTCAIKPFLDVRVGEIVAPPSLAREPGLASDGLLAANSNELLQLLTGLDFDGDANTVEAYQDLSTDISLAFTDSCTLRSHVAGGDLTSSLPDCGEAAASCTHTTPTCATTMTSCTAGMTPCRVEGPSMTLDLIGSNRIIALKDDDAPTVFTATFPRVRGVATTLAAAIGAADTSVTVTELRGYPTALPWDAVIESEIVRVTAVSGTTLTVTRGIAGTPAVAHDADVAFAQRTIESGTLPVTADGRTLASLEIEAGTRTFGPFGELQLQALGTFEDTDDTDPLEPTRTQRVTRLSTFGTGSPAVVWISSDPSVASVGAGSGRVFTSNACGGTVTIRARASSSTNTLTASFDPDSTADDDACTGTGGAADLLCHQTQVCVRRANPLPPGTTCDDPETTCP